MSRARHRKSQSRATITAAFVLSITAALGAQATVAGLTSNATNMVSVKAAKWTTPTVAIQGYNSASVSWDAVPGYTDYTLQYSKTPDFASPISINISANWSPMSTLINRLTNATTYYWRVKPTNSPADVQWGLQTSAATTNANATVKFGDMLAYNTSDRNTYNYGKTSQNANGSLRKTALTGTNIPTHMFVTDWNSDGIEDIFTQNSDGTGSLVVQFGKAGGGFTPFSVGYGTWNEYDVTIGKWPKDNSAPAILAIEKASGTLWNYTNPSGGNHGPRTAIGNGWGGFSTAIVDFDGDGNMDVISKQPATGQLVLYRGDGGGGFRNEGRQVLGTNWNTMDCIGVIEDSEGLGTKGVIAREIASANLYYYPIEDGILGERRSFGVGFYNYKISGS